MPGEPETQIDGLIKKSGSYGTGSACKGDPNNCMYIWYEGSDSAVCKLSGNQGVIDRIPIPAPLAITISAVLDAGSQSGTLTVKAVLDDVLQPDSGTVNKIWVGLYERGVQSSYGKDSILYPAVVRTQLVFSNFTVTQAGAETTFTAPFTLDPTWVPENIGALAFVQNYNGSSSTDPSKLIAGEVYNAGYLQSVIAPPPGSGHIRPVSHP